MIEVHRENDSVFVKPEGEISFLNAVKIKREILEALKTGDKVLVLNLSKVDFLDNAGLGLLISLGEKMRQQGGKLVVEYPKLGVQKLLEMAKMDQMMIIKKTEEPRTGSWEELE